MFRPSLAAIAAGSFNSNRRTVSTPVANPFSDVPLPAGALSFTVNWEDGAGESGYLVYCSTSTQAFPDPTLYAYQYVAAANASSLVISGVQSGTKYVRVAAIEGSNVGDLSMEIAYTPT